MKIKFSSNWILFLATQSLEPDLLIPLKFRCQKIMLVGDPEQLPPTVLSDAGTENNLGQSLYSRLFSCFEQYGSKKSTITMLVTQYRMHSELCQFSSRTFYDSRLETHPSVDERMKNFPLNPLIYYDLVNSRHEVGVTKSSFNMHEVLCIQRFCTMLATNVEIWRSLKALTETTQFVIQLDDQRSIEIQERIAVITPYQAQVNLLRKKLPSNIEVMTTDSSQGSEKDIVIISCVRGNDSIGFLKNKARLNVMLTRAKYGLYVFGNLTWLSGQDGCWKKLFVDARDRERIRKADISSITLPKKIN